MEKSLLISLVGKQTVPNYKMFKEYYPQVHALVYTNDTLAQKEILSNLSQKSNNCEVVSILINNEYDLKEIEKALNQNIYLQNITNIFVNITGGTKMMAIALFNYAQNLIKNKLNAYIMYSTVKDEYLEFDEDYNIKKDSFCENLSFEELFELNGYNITINENDLLKTKYEKLNSAFYFIKKNRDVFEKFLKIIPELYSNIGNLKYTNLYLYFKKLPNKTLNFKNFNITFTENLFEIKDAKNKLVLEMNNIDPETIEWFIFNAGWYELLVAFQASKKFEVEPNNVVLNLDIKEKNSNKSLNEIDVIINCKNELIFIEAKSGNVKSEDIDKINTRKNYGSSISKFYLAHRFPLTDSIKEKCKNSKIETQHLNIHTRWKK